MLVRRGTKSFISLHRQLRIKDEDSDGKITLPELKRAFGDYHIELSEAEFKAFFQSQESKGRITIDNFMSTLVGPLSPFKLELINQVFSMLDRDWDDLILLNELKNTYTARYHPDVRKGRKSESEVLAEFLDSFEAHHVLYSNIRDPKVSRREFRTYYQVVGAINDDDQTFDEIIKGC
jgi:Ca2+-binding EF-hand superfamily protein